jgi:hypothetical protein
MPEKKCDGTTVYTCTMEVTEESGTVEHWHAIDLEELAKASQNPPDFTYPFSRRNESWPDECSCPNECRKMVRDTRTKEHKGWRVARRRVGAGGTIFEIMKKTVEWWKVEVDFVCARVTKEEQVSMEFDPAEGRPAEAPAFASSNMQFLSHDMRRMT